MSTSIGSFNVSIEDCDLFQSPFLTTITNIESDLEGIFVSYHIQAIISEVSAAEANMPSGIKPKDISKLCIISETLSEGAANRNMKLMENKSDDALSRKFKIRDRMIQYRRIQRTLFSDTMF